MLISGANWAVPKGWVKKKVNKALAGTQLEPWLNHMHRHCVSGKIKGIADINTSEPKLHKSQDWRAAWYRPNAGAGITNGQHLLHYWSGFSSSEPVGIIWNFCSICTRPKISVKAPSAAVKSPSSSSSWHKPNRTKWKLNLQNTYTAAHPSKLSKSSPIRLYLHSV